MYSGPYITQLGGLEDWTLAPDEARAETCLHRAQECLKHKARKKTLNPETPSPEAP